MNPDLIYSLLKLHEGKKNKMYQDSLGIPTIGIGHNLRDVPISDAAVRQIFDDDVAEAQRQIAVYLPWVSGLDEVRQAVILDMWFNLGSKLLGFKNTLEAVREGRYHDAATEMLDSAWAKQVGKRANRLSGMMESGTWPYEITDLVG